MSPANSSEHNDPNNGSVFNISKATTVKELCTIRDIPEELRRTQGLNLSGGRVNAVEFATSLLKLPMLPELLDEFEEEIRSNGG